MLGQWRIVNIYLPLHNDCSVCSVCAVLYSSFIGSNMFYDAELSLFAHAAMAVM